VSQVVKGLRQSVTKRELSGPKRSTLLGVAAYLYRNRGRMRHDQYLANGWPIASGPVEGACKNLIKDRWNDLACAGPKRLRKPSSNFGPSISAETSLPTGSSTSCRKQRRLHLINGRRSKVATPESVIVVGETSAVYRHIVADIDPVVPHQLTFCGSDFRQIASCLDGDSAGRKASAVIAHKLQRHCSVQVIPAQRDSGGVQRQQFVLKRNLVLRAPSPSWSRKRFSAV